MEAVVCRKTGSIPKALGGNVEPNVKSAVVNLDSSFPRPAPSSQQLKNGDWVRIRVSAASLNFADVLTVMGKYQVRPPLPFVPGAEVSGNVTEVGPRVSSVREGHIVCAVVGTGAFAEEVVTDEKNVFVLPEGCDIATSAALPVAYGTAHLSLCHRAQVQPGEVVLVLGAGGGVGLAAVQIAKVLGANVIAVARGAEKARVLHDAGADCIIDTSKDASIISRVRSHVESLNRQLPRGSVPRKGVDIVLDTVGGQQFEEGLKVVNWGARILVIGFASGKIPQIAANIALVKNLTIHGIYWGSYMDHNPEVLHNSMEQLCTWFAQGKIKIHASHRFPFSRVLDAFGILLSRMAVGKVLLFPSTASKL